MKPPKAPKANAPKGIIPRNPLVALAKFKKAGAHEKTEKALRREAKMKLQHGYDGSPVETLTPATATRLKSPKETV